MKNFTFHIKLSEKLNLSPLKSKHISNLPTNSTRLGRAYEWYVASCNAFTSGGLESQNPKCQDMPKFQYKGFHPAIHYPYSETLSEEYFMNFWDPGGISSFEVFFYVQCDNSIGSRQLCPF